MARHNDWYRVSRIGPTDSPDGLGVADSFSDGFVADQFSVGNIAQCTPYFKLKGGPYWRQCDIESFQFSFEVGPQLSFDRREIFRVLLPIAPDDKGVLLFWKNNMPQTFVISNKSQGPDQAGFKIIVKHGAVSLNSARGAWPRKHAMDAISVLFVEFV